MYLIFKTLTDCKKASEALDEKHRLPHQERFTQTYSAPKVHEGKVLMVLDLKTFLQNFRRFKNYRIALRP